MTNIRAALDVGSSKIVCVIFEISSKGELRSILSNAVKASVGVKCGMIEDQKATASAISAAVYEAEKQASTTVKKAIVNISHPAILSKVVATKANLKGRQVSKGDLKDLHNKTLLQEVFPNYSAIHSFQISYDVDTQRGIQSPEYMFANTLTAYSSVAAIPKNYLNFVTKCLNRAHLVPEYFVIPSYSSSLAMDLKDLKDFILIDIGAGSSDIIVFDGNSTAIWAGVVPLGGNNITKDICSCFSVSFEEAERLKILYGKLGRGEPISRAEVEDKVDLYMLNKIITARMEEIIEIILNKIPLEYRLNRIILTGGGSKLLGIESFVSDTFNCHASMMEHVHNASPETSLKNDPIFSTCLGLMKFYSMELSKRNSLSFKKILRCMWESF